MYRSGERYGSGGGRSVDLFPTLPISAQARDERRWERDGLSTSFPHSAGANARVGRG